MKKSTIALVGLVLLGVAPLIMSGVTRFFFLSDEPIELAVPAGSTTVTMPQPSRGIASERVMAEDSVDEFNGWGDSDAELAALMDAIGDVEPAAGESVTGVDGADEVAREILLEMELERRRHELKMKKITDWIGVAGGVNTLVLGWVMLLFRKREHVTDG